MFQGRDARKGGNHTKIIISADEALTSAEQAIRIARDKLSNAQRNYEERLIIPRLGNVNASRRNN